MKEDLKTRLGPEDVIKGLYMGRQNMLEGIGLDGITRLQKANGQSGNPNPVREIEFE